MPQSGMGARRGWLLLSVAAFVLSACLLGWFVRMRMQADPFARSISAVSPSPAPPGMPSSPAPMSEPAQPASPAPPLPPPPPTPKPDVPTLSDPLQPGHGKVVRPAGPVRPAPRAPNLKKPAPTGAPLERKDDGAATGIAGLDTTDEPATVGKRGTKKQPAPQLEGRVRPSGEGGFGSNTSGKLGQKQPEPEAPNSGETEAQDAVRGAPAVKAVAPPADPLAGSFGLSAPREMSVGVSTHVRALLAPRELTAQFETELAAAVEEVQAGGASVTRKIVTVAPQMRVELKADSDADFEIKAFTPVEQVVDREQVTVWEWAVTPKQAGERTLTAIISSVAEPGKPARTRIQRALVQVKIMPVQRVREIAVGISGSLSAIAGAIGAWMGLLRPVLQRRRREGEEDGGDRRGPRPAGGGAGKEPDPAQPAQAAAPSAPAAAARPDGAKPAT